MFLKSFREGGFYLRKTAFWTAFLNIFMLFFWLAAAWAAPADDAEVIVAREDDRHFVTFDEIRRERAAGNYQLHYRLSKYDVLDISFPYMDKLPGLSGNNLLQVTIGSEGYILLPYIGEIKLSGLTVAEAKELMHERLRGYIVNPEISLTISNYGRRNVFVMGEVTKEGIYEFTPEYMHIFAALSSAGGIKLKGRPKHVALARMIDGELFVKKINFDSFVKKQDYTQNIVLEDGDMIYVPRSNKFDIYTDMGPVLSAIGLYRIIWQ
jgi:polysaccharide export outer membrane protein